jgi:pimeloyl-ACP methyl ester carboxylesterase
MDAMEDRMHATIYGAHQIRFVDRGVGEPIIFVHNAGVSHRLWDYQLDHFAQTHRVIALDLLGHGASDRPEIIYEADDFVAQVRHVADELGLGRFHLVGCCLGGGVALEFARRHPQRVCSLALITVTTPATVRSGLFGVPERISKPGSRLRNLMWRWCETPIGRILMSRALQREQCGPVALSDPAFRQYVTDLYRSPGQWRVFCNISYEGFRDLERFQKPADFPPTLMMWGGKNRVLRADAGRELVAAVKPDRAVFWDDNGYMLMRERVEETNRLLAEHIARAEPASENTRAAVRRDPRTPATRA